MWSQPADIFTSHYAMPNAFSVDSVNQGFKTGLYDKESLSLLRRVAKQADKVFNFVFRHFLMHFFLNLSCFPPPPLSFCL